MRYWIGAALAFFVALAQSSSVDQFRIAGVAPNLLLVLLVSWLVVRGLDDVLPMVAVAGITLGFVELQTPGLVLLALLPVAGLGIIRELRIIHSDLLLVVAFVVVATVAYELVLLTDVVVTGGRLDVLTAFRSSVVPAALVNAILTPPVYLLMRFAKPSPRRGGLSYR